MYQSPRLRDEKNTFSRKIPKESDLSPDMKRVLNAAYSFE